MNVKDKNLKPRKNIPDFATTKKHISKKRYLKPRKNIPDFATTKKHISKKRYERKKSKKQIDELIKEDV